MDEWPGHARVARRPTGAAEPDAPAPRKWFWPTGVTAWTDGACSDPAHPLLRRAGWGVTLARGGSELSRPLGGPVQTAQRAECRALVGALELTAGHCEVVTDSMFVVEGALALAAGRLPKMDHEDLWRRALAIWRPGISKVRKVKAHQSL